MMSSLFSAVSGLKAQQTSLDVIANNISNVNTTGYKSQRVTFSDLLSQTLSSASGSTATTGGTNAVQVGLGVSVASTDTNMSVGSTQSTGITTDLSISGSGFFIVQGGSTGEYQFTRNGSMDIDENGNLTIGGYEVCGWLDYTVDADGNYVYNTDAKVEPINIYSDDYNGNKKIIAAKASTAADFSGSLDPSASVAANATALNNIGDTTDLDFDQTSSITVYDAQGNSYDVIVNWKKCYVDDSTDTTSWYYELSSDGLTIEPSSGYLLFDSSGKIISDSSNTDFDTNPTVTLSPTTAGASAFDIALDFGDITTYTSSSTAKVTGTTDGYEAGELQSISISSDGTILGTYSNDQTQALGMIALAVFTNPEGLEKIGNNLYATSANSGNYTAVVAGNGGSGALSSGTLEMSNVDLASEFSSMMISQRAYQANSKVISTADEMLQSLINMAG
jgi:flagellar hook protein FlgE